MPEQISITYLGPSGTFTEKAAKDFNIDVKNPEWIEKGTIDDVIESVAQGHADRGVIPLRTDYGDVYDTLDKLHEVVTRAEVGEARQTYITGYGEVPIVFYLSGKAGMKLEDVEVVATKQQAIDACVWDLKRDLPKGYTREHLDSTALGAQTVAQSDQSNIATLCSVEAMNQNRLVSLLPHPITKTTRFIRIATEPYSGTQEDETAIMIRIYQDRPGQLHSITGAINPVNMTDIHLMKSKLDSYGMAKAVFVMRLEGNRKQADLVVNSLRAEFSKEGLYGITNGPRVDVLGTYPIIKL